MYYFFYKTTNKSNHKVYYGVHKTKNLYDGYLGSGRAISAAIKLYGKENFSREILAQFNSEEEMYEFERQFVTEEVVRDERTYNQTIGGRGGFSHIDNYGENNPMKNPEVVKKCVDSRKASDNFNLEANLKNLELAVAKNTGAKRPDHAKFMKEWAKENWEKNKETLRDALSTTFDIISPSGVKYTTNRLEEFCKDNDLPYSTLWNTSVTGVSPKKGKAKGWLCMKAQ